MARTIESPGVSIQEIDLSLRPTLPTGTSVFVAGFTPQGPTDEIVQVTSVSEFETIYGKPETPAERYLYHTVTPLLKTNAKVNVYKLPYGTDTGLGFGSNYGALVYPTSAVSIDYTNNPALYGKALATFNAQSTGVLYLVGKPYHYELTQDQYNSILQGNNGFSWKNTGKNAFTTFNDLGNAGIIVLNKGKTTVNNLFEGYYVGAVDNANVDPTTDFNSVISVQTVAASAAATASYVTVPSTRLNFALSASANVAASNSSVSEVLENASTFNIATNQFDDTLTLGLFKVKQSIFAPETIKLDYTLVEKYVGSLDYWRQINSQNGGQPLSFFLETSEDTSPNITVLVNEFISRKNGTTWLDSNGAPTNKVRLINGAFAQPSTMLKALSSQFGITALSAANTQVSLLVPALSGMLNYIGRADSLFTVGAYADGNLKTKDLGSIPLKLDRMFEIAENRELFEIDLSLDAGLTTIFATSEYINSVPSLATAQKYFDDTVYVAATTGLQVSNPDNMTAEATLYRNNYTTVFNKFADFATKTRKDHLFIADLPRHIFVQGANFAVGKDVSNSFSLSIYNPVKNVVTQFNTSYATTYGNWVKVYDNNLGDYAWVPFSGFAAASIATTDEQFQPWYAPAGFTRGVVSGVVELAVHPKQKQRDQLYKISVNPVTHFPNDGYVIYGQKTLLKQPSAFDRINVRRLFLALEKATERTVKYFVFEPNTLLTRTRVLNTLRPIFENAKNTEGLYDYLLICDERNNTPTVIDNNELVVDIYLKPVRTAEFIKVNFYATRTDANFEELVG